MTTLQRAAWRSPVRAATWRPITARALSEMPLSTPCIGLCVLDETAGICIGCGRTGQEIATWIAMGEEARRAVMRGLADRLAAQREMADGARPDGERSD